MEGAFLNSAGSSLSTSKRVNFERRRGVVCMVLGRSKVDLSNVHWTTPKGEGSYGAVFFGKDDNTGTDIVVKCPKDVPLAMNLLETEKYVNNKLSAVNGRWAEYMGSFSVPYEADVPLGTMRTCLVWRKEGDGSTLDDYLSKLPSYRLPQLCGVFEQSTSPLQRQTCKFVVKELLQCLIEMQEHGIMHRDIKPANIVVSPEAKRPFKVIDFGSSCDWHTPLKRGLSTATCDPVYAAPERRLNMFSPHKFDVFSVGLIGMQVLMPSLREQWQVSDFSYRLEKYDYDLVRWCTGILDGGGSCSVVQEVRSLYDDEELLPVLVQMLRKDPTKRASAEGALASGAFGHVAFGDE
eukprot:CAMPEP_0184744244 /NCGR_PEP_ID=MMETSP0315-20130426/7057_1 /TAXON_ID=101924 /ORGANISM="Rhodosorus marinus, Strain UTEX LB 2760" /LENGTH=349 /DNA_ID=CAMNT_0027215909 /DNA_START=200 /DNA_END=1249 /DNA_ORIENTATION=+